MNNFICKHRLISVGDPIYEWCRQCGILIYRYEEFMMMPSEDIQFVDGHLIYNKGNSRIERTRIVEPFDIRDTEHEHDFFVLSANDAWCKTCGSLKIKRVLMETNGFKYQTKAGLLVPQRRLSSIDVRKKSGMME